MTQEIKAGKKVHYTAPHGKKENGIVKSVDENIAFVVYHCDNDWDKYFDYTGAATNLTDLKYGWVDENGNLLKEFCNHHYIPSASKWQPQGRMTCINCNDTIE